LTRFIGEESHDSYIRVDLETLTLSTQDLNLISVVLGLWSEDNNFKQFATKVSPVTDQDANNFQTFSLNNERNSFQSFLSQVSFFTVCIKLFC
jgi:hypothetical protein